MTKTTNSNLQIPEVMHKDSYNGNGGGELNLHHFNSYDLFKILNNISSFFFFSKLTANNHRLSTILVVAPTKDEQIKMFNRVHKNY